MLVLRKEWITLAEVKLKNLDTSEVLTFKTLKKDRSVSIRKINIDCYEVIEYGFNNMTYSNLNLKQLRNLLKKLDTLEFPKSTKLHLSIHKIPSI